MKKGFLLYADMINQFDMLTDEQAGVLIKVIFNYANGNDVRPEIDDPYVAFAFAGIKPVMDRDAAKWARVRESRSRAGKSSAKSRKKKPEPQPATPRKAKSSPVAEEILCYLNEKSGRTFRTVDTHIRLIEMRLKEDGVTVEGVRQMIDSRCSMWKHDDKMSEFLRPQTLFGKTKFANYYDQRDQQKGVTEDDHDKGF